LLAIAWPSVLVAQGALVVRGTVVRQALDGTRPVAREQVTLHRVNAKEAGAVDSMTTDAAGKFSFRVASPDSQSMYLASARYAGIAYFSSPMQAGAPANAPAEIVVYDTTSAEVRLQLQGRHVVVSSPDANGVRAVIDVLEISNDTVVTRVAGAANRPTFSLLLPDQALEVTASQGDLSEGAVEFRGGRADIFLPLSPGLRQVVLTYKLPAKAYPVAIPLERVVSVLEVLLEEKGATAEGAGLVNKGGVSVDGKAFERYLAQNSAANAVVTLRAPGGIRGTSLPAWVVPVALGVVTLGIIVLLTRRAPAVAAPSPASTSAAAPTSTTASTASTTSESPAHRGTTAPRDATLDAPHTPVAVAAHAAPPGDTKHSQQGRVTRSAAASDAVTTLARQVASVDAVLETGAAIPDAARAELEAYRAALKGELVAALARRTQVQ